MLPAISSPSPLNAALYIPALLIFTRLNSTAWAAFSGAIAAAGTVASVGLGTAVDATTAHAVATRKASSRLMEIISFSFSIRGCTNHKIV
jgi:hypothetical protein